MCPLDEPAWKSFEFLLPNGSAAFHFGDGKTCEVPVDDVRIELVLF